MCAENVKNKDESLGWQSLFPFGAPRRDGIDMDSYLGYFGTVKSI